MPPIGGVKSRFAAGEKCPRQCVEAERLEQKNDAGERARRRYKSAVDQEQIREDGLSVQPAILPPPCLVIATTAGRVGMSFLKSGQRVDGSS